jgi:hypothetical protein
MRDPRFVSEPAEPMPADTPEGNPIAMGRPEHDKPGPTISDNEANEVARAIKSILDQCGLVAIPRRQWFALNVMAGMATGFAICFVALMVWMSSR